MKAKFIYEAFEKKTGSREQRIRELIFPNETVVKESLEDIMDDIAEYLTNEISSTEFTTSGHEKTYEWTSEIVDRYNDYKGINWESENGDLSREMLYTSIKVKVEASVEIEPFEERTRNYPGDPGGWAMYGALIELKIFNKEEVLNVSKKENADIFNIINIKVSQTIDDIDEPVWDDGY